MKNYYKHGNTVHMFDTENNIVISVTNSEYSRAMAISDNAPQAAQIMNHSFSSSLNVSQRGDHPILLSDEQEFIETHSLVKEYLISQSLNF